MKKLVWLLLATWGCADHDPHETRIGSPIPAYDSNVFASDAGLPTVYLSDTPVTWCQAVSVVQRKCQRCHTDPQQHGAPFPLLTYDNTQVVYNDRPVWQRMGNAVSSDFMPLTMIMLDPPVESLTCEEKTTLLSWLGQGAVDLGGTDCTNADTTLLPCALPGDAE